jgi:starch phosphorylase
MQKDLNTIRNDIQDILYQHQATALEEASNSEIYRATCYYLRQTIGKNIYDTQKDMKDKKTNIFLSLEYSPGDLLFKHINYMNVSSDIQNALSKEIINLNSLLEEDKSIELGKSYMGIYTDSLMDSFANLKINCIGYGLLYRDGYFKQRVDENGQHQDIDDWWSRGKNWLYKKEYKYSVDIYGQVETKFQDGKYKFNQINTSKLNIRSYDLPYISKDSEFYLKIRLFDDSNYTKRLLPKSTTQLDREEKLIQRYILVSSSLKDAIREYLTTNEDIDNFQSRFRVLLADSNLLIAIPEFMRILLDEYNLEWDEAWEITQNTFTYIKLKEDYLQAEGNLLMKVLPRVWMILDEIHHRYIKKITTNNPNGEIKEESILWDGEVRLINLAKATNTKIDTINPIIAISHRKYLQFANPELFEFINSSIKGDLSKDIHKIESILDFVDEPDFIEEIGKIKQDHKFKLAQKIFNYYRIKINPYALFDAHFIQINEKNRQLLEAVYIINEYLRLIDNPNIDTVPKVFFIAGKADSNDAVGKLIIKLIYNLSLKINKDLTIKDKLKLFFLDDYALRNIATLYTGIDLVESLATPTKEKVNAFKLISMINGSLAIGSKNKYNLDFLDSTKNTSYLFGSEEKEVQQIYENKGYNSQEYYYKNIALKKSIDTLNGAYGLFKPDEFKELFDLLIRFNDINLVLKDFEDYSKTRQEIDHHFLNKRKWYSKTISSIALIKEYSSDAVVKSQFDDLF